MHAHLGLYKKFVKNLQKIVSFTFLVIITAFFVVVAKCTLCKY